MKQSVLRSKPFVLETKDFIKPDLPIKVYCYSGVANYSNCRDNIIFLDRREMNNWSLNKEWYFVSFMKTEYYFKVYPRLNYDYYVHTFDEKYSIASIYEFPRGWGEKHTSITTRKIRKR